MAGIHGPVLSEFTIPVLGRIIIFSPMALLTVSGATGSHADHTIKTKRHKFPFYKGIILILRL